MTKKLRNLLSPEEQHERFVATAREIGADEQSSNADALLGRLAKMPPNPKLAKGKSKTKPLGSNSGPNDR